MITSAEYTGLDHAYDWFNADLFSGQLPAVLFTFQRKRGAMGYFSPARFQHRRGPDTVDEVALNPASFDGIDDLEILQTLVHEMAHVWQAHLGQPGRGGYHNREWATKMEAIGLMPSSTGKPGGKATGDKMADYIIEGASFEKSAKALLANGFAINWQSRERTVRVRGSGDSDGGSGGQGDEGKPPTPSKVKFSCPECSQNAWGKPALNLLCGDCSSQSDKLVRMEKK